MDQTAANVAEQTKQPKHEQDDNYGPQHRVIPFRFTLLLIGIYPEEYLFAKLFPNMFRTMVLPQALMSGRALIFSLRTAQHDPGR